jgi:hypothetical protein
VQTCVKPRARVRGAFTHEHFIRIDLALDLAIDKKLFFKLDRAFDFDITREKNPPSA